MKKRNVILASASVRRAKLLRQLGIDFKVVESNYKENMKLKLSDVELVKKLAYGKAKNVLKKINKGIIIGADTFVKCGDIKLGKPHNANNAKKMLKKISGKKIKVISGIAVIDIDNKKEFLDFEITDVYIKKLTDKEIDWYVSSGEPFDKAGAFGIQGKGAFIVKKINGCYSNVVGLPLHKLYVILNKINFFD